MTTTATDIARRPKNAGKRKDIEDWILSHNVEFTYEGGVSTDGFDIPKSQANQARFKDIDRNVVEQYKDALARGDQFPAVVAHRPTARGKLVITDGNHRLIAHAELGMTIDVYVLGRVRGVTLTAMTYEANTRHGLPTSVEERTVQAVWLIDSGATHEAAAAAVNVRLAEVKRAWSKAQSERRADEVGIPRSEWDTLAQSVRNRLQTIYTDEGFRVATRLAYKARLNADEVFELVADVNKSRAAVKQQAVVKGYESVFTDRIQDTAGGLTVGSKKSRGPRQTFLMALGQVNSLERAELLAGSFSEQERDETVKRTRDAAKRLVEIADRLEGK